MDAADEKKGEEVLALEVTPYLGVVDYFVLATGTSDRSVSAISDEIQRRLRTEFRIKPSGMEGRAEARWILLDYVDFVVHIFQPEARQEYRLESLFGNASRLFSDGREEAHD